VLFLQTDLGVLFISKEAKTDVNPNLLPVRI
jgi:hypothetical protein